jgi:hypothetical protein
VMNPLSPISLPSLSPLSPLSPLFFLFSANDNATCVLEESPGKAGAFLSVCFVVRGWCGPDSSGRCWWCLCVLCCCRHWCLCVAVFASFGHYLGEAPEDYSSSLSSDNETSPVRPVCCCLLGACGKWLRLL